MEKKINNKTVHDKADSSKPIYQDVDKTKNTFYNDEFRVIINAKIKGQNDATASQKTNQLAMGDNKKKKTEKPKNTAVINVKRSATDKKVAEESARTQELVARKQLRERYTFKLQNGETNDIVNVQEDAQKATIRKQEKLEMQRNDKPQIQKTDPKNNVKEKEKARNDDEDAPNIKEEKPAESSEDSGISVDIPAAKKDQRKPIIKTITTKNDTTRIYKAVTFVDNEQRKRSTLEINIPTDAFKKSRSKFNRVIKSPTKKVRTSVRSTGKPSPERKRDKDCALSSPELSIAGSPEQTEVAKWMPTTTDQLTKPYYEAWVDTTVAAAFREEMDDAQKQLIIESIKKSIRDKEEQRTNPLDLQYENFKDESYTGRIKIRHRERKRSKKENLEAV